MGYTPIKSLDLGGLEIRQYPDPALRQPCLPIADISDEIVALADRMIDLMIAASGIGLAAPQVAVPLRLVVISLTGKRENAEVFINPELHNLHGSSEMEEGCLSIPGIRGKVRRSAACAVEALDLDGNKFVLDAVDLAATCIQHETDHLDGTLFIDRLTAVSQIACRKAIKLLEDQQGNK